MPPKKQKKGGRRRRRYDFGDFVQDINKANPVMWGIKNHPNVGIKLGQATNDYALPAVVAVGKPAYDASAMVGSTVLTGNPLAGKIVGDQLWNTMADPYDPRRRQKSKMLGQVSGEIGKAVGKETSARLGSGYDSSSDEDEDVYYPLSGGVLSGYAQPVSTIVHPYLFTPH